jgi:hypothetical protein
MAIFSHNGIPKNSAIRTAYSHYKSAERRIETFQNKGLVQIPSFYFPHSGYTGSLWIEMQPRKLDEINTGGRAGSFKTTEEGTIYRFLAPVDGIQETHNHSWEVYESMYTKLLKMFTNLEVGVKQAKGAGRSLLKNFNRYLENGTMPTASEFSDAFLEASAYNKPKKKIDSPLAYENSARRQFYFTFPLLSEGLKTDLVKIVKDIQEKAAPSQGGGIVGIEWPWVWNIQSEPRGILDVDIAACTSIQATWLDPYLGGVPQRCELTLSFTDISPLFADTIIYGSLVNIDSGTKDKEHLSYSDHLRNKGTLPKEIQGMVKDVKEKLGYPKTNTPINP